MTHKQKETLLAMRPKNVVEVVGKKSQVLALNSKHIFEAIFDQKLIIMACNCRIPHVIPGILRAAEELDAVVAFELAKTEGFLDGGYTAQTPQQFAGKVFEEAEKLKHSKPFFVHGDHIFVRKATSDEVDTSAALIAAEHTAGYSSFAIDASHLEMANNIAATVYLTRPIVEWGLGLEVEVGEIAGAEGRLTDVSEAKEFIEALRLAKVQPQLLAISNGSKHGNYSEGEEVHIDLDRTTEIFDTVKKHGVAIAQHGITGTPLHLVGRFTECGIRKGNVGTVWQNIAHKHLPAALFDAMKQWADDNGKDIKYATREFKYDIDNIPKENITAIQSEAYVIAKEFIEAFRATGSATIIANKLAP